MQVFKTEDSLKQKLVHDVQYAGAERNISSLKFDVIQFISDIFQLHHLAGG